MSQAWGNPNSAEIFYSSGGLAEGDNSEMNYSFNENDTTGSFSEDLDESFERGGSFAASRNAALEAKVLAQLNSKGITNRSGGHFGQSLHVPKCGYHEVGDVEFVIDDIKVHAHADVLSEHSDYLKRVFKRFRYWNGFEQGGGSSREAQGRRNLFERHYRRGDSNFVFYSSCLLLRNKEIRHARGANEC